MAYFPRDNNVNHVFHDTHSEEELCEGIDLADYVSPDIFNRMTPQQKFCFKCKTKSDDQNISKCWEQNKGSFWSIFTFSWCTSQNRCVRQLTPIDKKNYPPHYKIFR